MNASPGIAIVGLAARFPAAENLARYWQNILAGVDAITGVPESRIPAIFFDRSAGRAAIDRLPCARGGFLGESLTLDVASEGLMPVAARGAEPDQLLALDLARKAFADAGLDAPGGEDDRTAVILGRGGYLGPGLVRADQTVRGAEQLAGILRRLLPALPDSEVEAVKLAFQQAAGPYGPDTAIGLVPNLAASRIANRLDLHGPAFTLDAACASSLLAVEQASLLLNTDRADRVLAGGIHLVQDVTFWSVFAQLGALSSSEMIRPFDRRADGLLIGEGAGLLVLERLGDALAARRRIYAVIRGVGSASDGRGTSVMQPRQEGQQLALARAWAEAKLSPETIGLVEGHGTGTVAGDGVELETLQRFFGPAGKRNRPRAILGSVKSMIGHTMPAAGAAGLIKAALAIHHRTLPPSLHCEEPHPGLGATRFEVLPEARHWDDPHPVAAVNAFGFGGIDAHVVLEAPPEPAPGRPRPQTISTHGPTTHTAPPAAPPIAAARPPARARVPGPDAPPELLRLGAPSASALLSALERIGKGTRAPGPLAGGPFRLAIVEPTADRLARARRVIARGEAWRGRGGIWFSPEGLASRGGKVAFLFPGIDADFRPRVASLAAHLDLPLPEILRGGTGEEDPAGSGGIEQTGLGVYQVNKLCFDALSCLGLRADAMAGHSIGEWSAMIHGGLLPQAAVDTFLERMSGTALEVPGVLFAAATCSVERALAVLDGLFEIGISHDNCPHQVILCGQAASIETARARLISSGVVVQILPFRSGFHSPLFRDYLEPHREHFAALPIEPTRTPVYSATTCAPFPAEPSAVRELALRHLIEPVRFRELLEALYAHGHSIFVQVGTGSLPGFVGDTFGARPHLLLTVSDPRRSGLHSLARIVAGLFVEGIDLPYQVPGDAPGDLLGMPPESDAVHSPEGGQASTRGAPLLTLPLGPPFLGGDTMGPVFDASSSGLSLLAPRLPPTSTPQHDPLRAEVEATLEHLFAMQVEILETYQRAIKGRSRVHREQRTLSVRTVPALFDHSFYPQGEVATLAERDPVVPMTMSVELLLAAAEEAFPGRRAIGLLDLKMHQWLRVHPPAKVTLVAEPLVAKPQGKHRARVWIDGFCEATVLLADAFPDPPAPALPPLQDPAPPPIDAATLYADRWMFHGPAYQGVETIGEIGSDGVRGTLKVTTGPGALLDSVGQLFGFWLMATRTEDRLAMPIGIASLERFGPHPEEGARLEAEVRITACDARRLVGEMEVLRDGKLWCRIKGWADHRFPSDAHTWQVLQHAESHHLSHKHEPYVLFDGTTCTPPSRDWLMRRMLSERERTTLLASAPQAQRAFLHARIAAKDAVRDLLARTGEAGRDLFPNEVPLEGDHEAGFRLGGPFAGALQIDAACTGDLAVAIASSDEVAIMLFPLGELPPAARQATFSREALALACESKGEGEGTSTQSARLRLWAAQAVVARLAARAGLAPDASNSTVTKRRGDSLRVGDTWAWLREDAGHLVAWARR